MCLPLTRWALCGGGKRGQAPSMLLHPRLACEQKSYWGFCFHFNQTLNFMASQTPLQVHPTPDHCGHSAPFLGLPVNLRILALRASTHHTGRVTPSPSLPSLPPSRAAF